MRPAHLRPRRPAGRRRGVTLIEALVALLVMSFGMVALVGLMANLRRSGEVARQRGDAMRFAQGELASLRSFAVLASTTTQDYDNSIASHAPYDIPGQDLTTSYTLTRVVTPLVKGSAEPRARTMSVTVSWQDRAGQQGSITLDSIVSRTDPAFAGATGIAPPTHGMRIPSGRDPAVPVDAADLTDDRKRSAFRPPGGGSAVWVFNNLTGVIASVCTIPTDTPVASLTAAAVADAASCTGTTAYLVSGTIRFSNTSPANPTTPEAPALPSVTATVSLLPSQFSDPNDKTKLALNAGYPRPPQCFSDAPSGPDATRTFVNYNCVVYPNTQAKPNWWGQVLVDGLSVGTAPTQFRVCRYSADYNGNGYTFVPDASALGHAYLVGSTPSYFLIDNEEHPDIYRGVTRSLVRQNFLVVRGDVACPAAPAPDPVAGIFIDYSAPQIQPAS